MSSVQASGKDDFSLISLNSTTEKINKTLGKIKEDFLYIGFLLWEVREYKFYESKGYGSVVEYAEKELNFKKSSTYNFISVCEKFSCKKDNGNPTMNLDSKYKDFSFGQLIEIKSLSEDKLESIDSNMSTRDIREKKKELNKEPETTENNIIDVDFKADQELLVKNQINVEELEIKQLEAETQESQNKVVTVSDLISDILKTLLSEWSTVKDDEYARGLNRAIQIINEKCDSNS